MHDNFMDFGRIRCASFSGGSAMLKKCCCRGSGCSIAQSEKTADLLSALSDT